MKQLKHGATLAVFAISAACGSAMAANTGTHNGQINFNGVITTTPCSIDGNNLHQTVELGSISTNMLGKAGAQAPAKDFEIRLIGCDASTVKNARITFSGTPVENQPELLQVGAGMPDAAKNVGVAIYDKSNNQSIELGKDSADIPLKDGLTVLPFSAQYQATAAVSDTNPVVAGNANASAQFTISYN